MLYRKNNAKDLDKALFERPTSEYRGAPFWAWNTALNEEELLWQIGKLKEMGFGGYVMHVRSGMATKYLSDEFMALIKACVEKGKREGMYAWLYDEDRWPSGAAGGFVTRRKEYRQKHILVTPERMPDAVSKEEGIREGKPYLLAAFDLTLDGAGKLVDYRMQAEDSFTAAARRYVYVCTSEPSGWFNGNTYADTLNRAAVQEFVNITHERYFEAAGEEFSRTVPAIFSDEPQTFRKAPLPSALGECTGAMPWTTDFDESFRARYGYSMIEKLPEIFWDRADGTLSQARYHYHNHIADLFAEAFADTCGNWCNEHGIYFAGHVMQEGDLAGQTACGGECMRFYRGFGLPGIDMLCDHTEHLTAKQAQSAAHQYGREGMLSELYGVTGWDFDFRGHKFQGDWQAAMGVTVRVPHLSWVSMRGSAKRDYPASIHYQSAWYTQYPYMEDHFARLNTALTRGKPLVNIAVLHPVETTWLHFGPNDTSSPVLNAQDARLKEIVEWLLRTSLDFDFISESLLPDLYRKTDSATLAVGDTEYRAVVIPPIETIRQTTLSALTDFVNKGGTVVFTGDCPTYADGAKSNAARELYERSEHCLLEKSSLIGALERFRLVSVLNEDGTRAENLIYTMREDGENRWLFLAHADRIDHHCRTAQKITVCIRGRFRPVRYDTLNGNIVPIGYRTTGDQTVLTYPLFAQDSLLLKLEKTAEEKSETVPESTPRKVVGRIVWNGRSEYERSEPNVLVLDIGNLSWDCKGWAEREEMLRTDERIRREFSWPLADGKDCQPWAIEEEKPTHFPYIRFVVKSEIEIGECMLAHESTTEIFLNGARVPVVKSGYFVDHEIFTTKLPKLRKGENEIVVRMPISKRISMENCYLLGDFGVRLEEGRPIIVKKAAALSFRPITKQGMPFYGGNVTYRRQIETPDCDLRISTDGYVGALLSVKLDGKEEGKIVYAPYRTEIADVKKGKHILELTLYGTRGNCFGALHDTAENRGWKGPLMYYTKGEEWSYGYRVRPMGLDRAPVIEILERDISYGKSFILP